MQPAPGPESLWPLPKAGRQGLSHRGFAEAEAGGSEVGRKVGALESRSLG